ncbi:MAG: hypothetical protein Hals2KO_17090 [Halioglobus sp.]
MGRVNLSRATTALLLSGILTAVLPCYAVDSDLYLAGLGLHQETGRNIYLGGIYLERETQKPQDLTATAGERIMEYRVVARRTSIRSLLGGMLLQSEVATGNPPDKSTADFVDGILSTVNTSLYAGDSLEIRLTDKNETMALLNGHELARVDDRSVADYLLMGWVGESGPSTTFRNKITAEQVDPSLLSALQASIYTEKRSAEIATWLDDVQPAAQETPSASTSTPVTDTVGDQSISGEALAATSAIDAATGDTAGLTTPGETYDTPETGGFSISVVDAPADSQAQPAAQGNTELQFVVPNRGPLQLASLSPAVELLPLNPLEREVQALGIQEYSQRLSQFHSDLIRKVYAAIRYPSRAVRRGLEGRLELDISMTASGQLLGVTIASPSGHTLLDEAAIAAAEKAFDGGSAAIDPVAVAEFGDFASEHLTVPVPVNFLLQ